MSLATETPGISIPDGMQGNSYWLEGLPAPEIAIEPLPEQVDVLVIGAGYTGLNAAIETARGGLSTLVLDAGEPGHGCSTRNGGQISTSVKPSLAQLGKRVGPERATAIRAEGRDALEWIEQRIRDEGIDCDFRRCGRFHAAHTPEKFEDLCREAERLQREEAVELDIVPRDQQHREIGSDAYHGGIVYTRHASVHPARLHRGLLASARQSGALVLAYCAVTALARRGDWHELQTQRGVVRARKVIVATNGYTGAGLPWFQRRVIPIGSYIIATEPLPSSLVDRLFPTDRIVSDSCKVVYYFRLSPDRQRILFGGRVSANETDTAISGPKLHRDLCRLFPELQNTAISHSWRGTVAYSFDELAHTGVIDGVYYAMGYCGSGVSMACYLGMRTGQKVLGLAEGKTAFDDLPFPTRPLYTGKPWFLPPLVAWYRWQDQRQFNRHRRRSD